MDVKPQGGGQMLTRDGKDESKDNHNHKNLIHKVQCDLAAFVLSVTAHIDTTEQWKPDCGN